MRRAYVLSRRTEGKTWRADQPLAGGYLKIEMTIFPRKGERTVLIRVVQQSAYDGVEQYPEHIPAYRYEDYLAEVWNGN